MLSDFALEQVIVPLQTWFEINQRDLRWRREPKAYYVWISEIMLQQTRVEAVKHYFDRFIEELPDVRALAECEEDRLLKLWEGLGYYNRARNLKKAATQIVENYGGVIPDTYEELLKLKGIGSYTAGAIASIAYQKPVCAVDGNVLRVLARVSGDDSDIAKQSVKGNVEKQLNTLIEAYSGEENHRILKPRIFNQALMELGALVCVPNGAPLCEECPWNTFCVARRMGKTKELPVKTKAKQRRVEEKTVLILRMEHKVAIRKRKAKGLLHGLYELPNLDGFLTSEEVLAYLKEQGFSPLRIQPLREAKHIFSHVEWHMKGYQVRMEEGLDSKEEAELLFVDVEEIESRYAIPSAFLAYRDMIMK